MRNPIPTLTRQAPPRPAPGARLADSEFSSAAADENPESARRAPGAGRGGAGRVGVGMGLRMWAFLLVRAVLKVYGPPGYAAGTQAVTVL